MRHGGHEHYAQVSGYGYLVEWCGAEERVSVVVTLFSIIPFVMTWFMFLLLVTRFRMSS